MLVIKSFNSLKDVLSITIRYKHENILRRLTRKLILFFIIRNIFNLLFSTTYLKTQIFLTKMNKDFVHDQNHN